MSILLSLLLSLTGANVFWHSPMCNDPEFMGFYETGTNRITVCKKNAQSRRISLKSVVKHEFVHFVYDRRGPDFIALPDPILTSLVRHLMPSGEVMLVISSETDYSTEEELTARMFSKLPDFAFVLWASAVLSVGNG